MPGAGAGVAPVRHRDGSRAERQRRRPDSGHAKRADRRRDTHRVDQSVHATELVQMHLVGGDTGHLAFLFRQSGEHGNRKPRDRFRPRGAGSTISSSALRSGAARMCLSPRDLPVPAVHR